METGNLSVSKYNCSDYSRKRYMLLGTRRSGWVAQAECLS